MLKYEDNLWGKIEFLHNRYNHLYSNLHQYFDFMNKFQSSLQSFSKSLNDISIKKYKIYRDKNLSLYPVIGSIQKNILLHSKEFSEISEFIQTKIIDQAKLSLNDTYSKENNLYYDYIRTKKNYSNIKLDLDKAKNNFNNNAKLCENLILNAKKMKYNDSNNKEEIEKKENMANEGISEAINYEKIYIESLSKTNKNREELNNKEKKLLKMYEDIEMEIMIKIKGMICMYIAGFKKMYSTILNDISWINAQFKKINSENDINIFINKYKSELKKEEKIPFIPYEPRASLKPKITGDSQKDENLLDINYDVISSLKHSLKNVCPSINLEEETKKKKLRYLVNKMFNINKVIKDEEKKELLDYIKEIPLRKYFIILLSNQRTHGRFSKRKSLIEDLSKILNIILEYSEKENDYEEAKNCLILSQTFYYEIIQSDKNDKNEDKYYIFNNIKKNKWLNSLNFWENLIACMIQKEIKNNESNRKKYNFNENYTKNAINNIVFSQLLTFSQNMAEFGFEKKIIESLCQKFIDKYETKKEYAETIINNINKKKTIISKEENNEVNEELEKFPQNKKLPEKENENKITQEKASNDIGADNNSIINNNKIEDNKE